MKIALLNYQIILQILLNQNNKYENIFIINFIFKYNIKIILNMNQQLFHVNEQLELDNLNINNKNLPHLTNLINQLHTNILSNNKSIKYIKNPKKLYNSLIKLYNIIGMNDIKESIAQQTSYLMNKLEYGDFSLKMLNTILFGDPGVGKTTIGIILAEIWYHLGFLQEIVKKKEIYQQNLFNTILEYDQQLLQIYFISFLLILSNIYNYIIIPIYRQFGFITTVMLITITLILLFYIFYHYYYKPNEISETNNDNLIVITSRSTFVGPYVGWTAPQVEKFLNNNRGKVVLIDEAYSLYNGPGDTFGMEALTAINKYISEHADEIVVIFAGYEDLMMDGIFKVQPGLNRRCMWQFKCPIYSGEELFDIFELQLQKEKYKMNKHDKFKIQDCIIENEKHFVNNAGDTEKLAFFSQLNHASSKLNNNIINYKDVKEGMKKLIENNMKHVKDDKDNLLKKLSQKLNL